MKKIFILALPLFLACNTATNKTETVSESPILENTTTTSQPADNTIITQTSYDPELQAIKWNGIKEMTDETFKSQVMASSTVTLVDFNATWCGPCRMQKPTLDKLAKEYAGKINFASVDVDVCPKTAQFYRISSIPTLTFIQNAKVGGSTIGLTQYAQLKAMIDKSLKAAK